MVELDRENDDPDAVEFSNEYADAELGDSLGEGIARYERSRQRLEVSGKK